MINKIETKNLLLRKARYDDLESIWNNVWKDETLASTMLWRVTDNINDAKGRLERTIKYQSKNYSYFICLKEKDEPIGFIGFIKKKMDVYEDYGLCIARKYQKNGYGKEALGAILNVVFENLNGKKFTYSLFSTNENSRKVCLAFGFKYFESRELTREHDNKKFLVDYYYLDKDMYEKEKKRPKIIKNI